MSFLFGKFTVFLLNENVLDNKRKVKSIVMFLDFKGSNVVLIFKISFHKWIRHKVSFCTHAFCSLLNIVLLKPAAIINSELNSIWQFRRVLASTSSSNIDGGTMEQAPDNLKILISPSNLLLTIFFIFYFFGLVLVELVWFVGSLCC